MGMGPSTAECFGDPQKAVSSTPVLRYNSLKEVTLQCDGLTEEAAHGICFMSPYLNRVLQIEKELLAIVFACNHFEAYIYGRDAIQVETDHQPLVSIVKKPLNSTPSWLQRMLLKLQKKQPRPEIQARSNNVPSRHSELSLPT